MTKFVVAQHYCLAEAVDVVEGHLCLQLLLYQVIVLFLNVQARFAISNHVEPNDLSVVHFNRR
mgnify:CR=1 FL=1